MTSDSVFHAPNKTGITPLDTFYTGGHAFPPVWWKGEGVGWWGLVGGGPVGKVRDLHVLALSSVSFG